MKIRYYGPFGLQTGYAQAAHDYMMALDRTDAGLEIVSLNPISGYDLSVLDDRYEGLTDLVEEIPHCWEPGETHRVVHTVPMHAHLFVNGEHKPADSVPRICITTWETDHLPYQIAESLFANFDKVIVPSGWCAEVLGREHLGLREKIRVVPHTFDPGAWPRELKIGRSDDPYTFLSILGWSERKNPIGILKAYTSEFGRATTSEAVCENVVLKILAPSYSWDDYRVLCAASGLATVPEVQFITERQSHEQLLKLYRSSDCFVTASRGEAWNLPAFEAAALGLPVIATGWSGHMHFLANYENAEFIPYHLTPAISPPVQTTKEISGIKIPTMSQIAPSGVTAKQSWAEPSLHALRMMMREAYERRWERDYSCREAFEKLYGYDTVGPRLLREIEHVDVSSIG